jgi:long-chain fatty acid transport protein
MKSTITLAGLSLLLTCSTAWSGGFSIREQSAEGLGAAFAGIAAGTNGLSAMYWNPATISQHNAQGYISESNVSLILPYSRAKDGLSVGLGGVGGSPDSGNIGETAIVPASYNVYGLTDEITLGLSLTAPLGLVTDANTWAGAVNGNKSDIFTLNASPTVAWEPVEGLTFAAGGQIQYMSVLINSVTPGGLEVFDADADDFGFGFTLGALWEPTDDLDIGIGFRSSIKHNLKGNGDLISPPTIYLDRRVSARFNSPEIVTLGVKYQATDQVKLMAGVEWANWSRFDSLNVQLSEIGATLVTPEKWKDSWFFSAGAEYALDDMWTLRAGAAYEKSPVPDATRTPRLPDNDRIWVSAGVGLKVNDWLTANLSYSHVFMKDGSVALTAPTSPAPLTADFKQHIDIVSASAVIDW